MNPTTTKTAWDFLAGLPVGIWYALAGAVVLAVVLFFGGTIAAGLATIFRGGKIHAGKDGVTMESPDDDHPTPPTAAA